MSPFLFLVSIPICAAPLTTVQFYGRTDDKKEQKTQLPEILATLVALGRTHQVGDAQFAPA